MIARVFWFIGPSGVGKHTLVHDIAEHPETANGQQFRQWLKITNTIVLSEICSAINDKPLWR